MHDIVEFDLGKLIAGKFMLSKTLLSCNFLQITNQLLNTNYNKITYKLNKTYKAIHKKSSSSNKAIHLHYENKQNYKIFPHSLEKHKL